MRDRRGVRLAEVALAREGDSGSERRAALRVVPTRTPARSCARGLRLRSAPLALPRAASRWRVRLPLVLFGALLRRRMHLALQAQSGLASAFRRSVLAAQHARRVLRSARRTGSTPAPSPAPRLAGLLALTRAPSPNGRDRTMTAMPLRGHAPAPAGQVPGVARERGYPRRRARRACRRSRRGCASGATRVGALTQRGAPDRASLPCDGTSSKEAARASPVKHLFWSREGLRYIHTVSSCSSPIPNSP